MKIPKLVLTLLIFAVNFYAYPSSTQEQIELVHSKFEEPLIFNVFLPSGYLEDTKKEYIMLFDFHPYSHTYLSGMHDWLSHNGEWPWLKTIIVTPAFGNRAGMLFDETGKTTPLLDFFDQQLFPAIDKKYRTNGFRIMSGFRTNGTIVLSALLNKPHMLNAYIATSPELKDNYAQILSSAKKGLAKLNDKPRFLLFSHGTNVKEEHQMESYALLHDALKQTTSTKLDWHYQHFEQNYFMSLPLVSVIMGVEKLFDDIHNGISPQSEIAQSGVESLVAHYQYLSEQKYGFEVSPKHSIEKLGEYTLGVDQNQGIAILKKLIILYPEDSYSYHNVASAYAQIGDFENAVKYQKEAVSLSKNRLTWHQNKHQNALENYLLKVNKTSYEDNKLK